MNSIEQKASNATQKIMKKVLYNFSGRYISDEFTRIIDFQNNIYTYIKAYYSFDPGDGYVLITIKDYFDLDIDDIKVEIWKSSKDIELQFLRYWKDTNGLVRDSFNNSFKRYLSIQFSERVVKL